MGTKVYIDPMVFEPGRMVNATLFIANKCPETLYNLYLYCRWPEGIRSTGPTIISVPRLRPGEKAERKIAIRADSPGYFMVDNCALEYRDKDKRMQKQGVTFFLYAAKQDASQNFPDKQLPLLLGKVVPEKPDSYGRNCFNLSMPIMNIGHSTLREIVVIINTSLYIGPVFIDCLEPGEGWSARFVYNQKVEAGPLMKVQSCYTTQDGGVTKGPELVLNMNPS